MEPLQKHTSAQSAHGIPDLPKWVDAALAITPVEGGQEVEVLPMEELVYFHNIIRAESDEIKKNAFDLASLPTGNRKSRDIIALIERTRSLRSLLKCHCKSG